MAIVGVVVTSGYELNIIEEFDEHNVSVVLKNITHNNSKINNDTIFDNGSDNDFIEEPHFGYIFLGIFALSFLSATYCFFKGNVY